MLAHVFGVSFLTHASRISFIFNYHRRARTEKQSAERQTGVGEWEASEDRVRCIASAVSLTCSPSRLHLYTPPRARRLSCI